MDISRQLLQTITRRHFLRDSQLGLGALALAGLGDASAAAAGPQSPPRAGRAKHVIYLHMAGSPPQHELFDYSRH